MFELIIFRNGHGAMEHLVRWERGENKRKGGKRPK